MISYKLAVSLARQRQILALLVPAGLIVLSGLLNWIGGLAPATGRIPPELIHLISILVALSFTGAVVRYGLITGRPVTRRELFYSMLAAAAGLGILSLTVAIDRWLAIRTPFTYPLVTGAVVVIVAAGFSVLRRWITRRLDPLLFQAEARQRALTHQLGTALSETPDFHQFQEELLSTLCLVLNVRGGYLAFEEKELPDETLKIRLVQGTVSVNVGDQIRQPPSPATPVEAQLVTTLPAPYQTSRAWRNMAVLCPLTGESGQSGFLALAEKRDRAPFTPAELALCSQLISQLNPARQMMAVQARRTAYLEAANYHSQALQVLPGPPLTSPSHDLPAGWPGEVTSPPDAPLAIRLFGPMQVVRTGQTVSDEAWETQKARVLLAYLLWKGPSGATRENISETLWPDRPIDQTANVFHVTLHHLRRVLEPDLERTRNSQYLLYNKGKYRFNFAAPHWLDVTAFQKLAAGQQPEALKQAVTLYRGPYLEDIALSLPPDIEVERRRLERIYLDTLRRLAARANGHTLLTYLEQLVAVDPLDETAQQALVLGYLARHRRDLACRQVARWQQTLAELEVEPSPEARAFWEQVEN
jgi:DNA-binding SARP family transcriptional activator